MADIYPFILRGLKAQKAVDKAVDRMTREWVPTTGLRWNGTVLEQRWAGHGSTSDHQTIYEWRPVPNEPAEQPDNSKEIS